MCIVGVKLPRVLSRRAGRSRGRSNTHRINILLMKSNSKFESRATAVSVTMSPRYRGSKYRSRLHPRSRKCACQFFLRETGRVKSNCARPASSAKLQRHTALSNENDKFYTTMIYPCFSRSVCFSMRSPA